MGGKLSISFSSTCRIDPDVTLQTTIDDLLDIVASEFYRVDIEWWTCVVGSSVDEHGNWFYCKYAWMTTYVFISILPVFLLWHGIVNSKEVPKYLVE